MPACATTGDYGCRTHRDNGKTGPRSQLSRLYRRCIVDTLHCRLDGTHLSVNFDHGLAMARIYLVPAVCAQADPGNIIYGLIMDIVLTRRVAFPSRIRRDRIRSIGYVSLTENRNLLHLDTTRRNAFDKNGRSSVPRALG